ncbi:MAG: hypothetical protein ABI550_02075 [Ignavibacteriaceae bacterium]
MKKIVFFILLLSAAAILYSALLLHKTDDIEKIKSQIISEQKNSLREDLYKNGAVIVYASQNKKAENSYYNAAIKLQKKSRWIKFSIKKDLDVSEIDLKNNSIVLLGKINSNKILNKISNKIPIQFEQKNYKFNNIIYNDSLNLIFAFIPSPFNLKKSCFIISGLNDDYISQNADFEFISDVRITQGYEALALGFFTLDDRDDWVIDKSSSKNFSQEKKVIKKYSLNNYVVHSSDFNDDQIKKINNHYEKQFFNMKRFFGEKFFQPKLSIHLYNNLEQKGLIIENTQINNIVSEDSSIHIFISDWLNGNDFSQNALMILRKNFGKINNFFLERGLSIYFAESWRGEDYKYWASRLFLSENVPSLSVLMYNKKVKYESDFLVAPLSAAFAEFMIKKLGREKFINFFADWNPNEKEIELLNIEFQNFLNNLSKNYSEKIKENRRNFPLNIPEFQKGFCFAHEGYQIHNGYLSQDAFLSLEKLKDIGINSFSITPFTSMKDPAKSQSFNFWQGAYEENDESLIKLKHNADKLGLTIIMKPHIYFWNSWPGAIKMDSEKDWDNFFDNYYKWILHYSILSEMYKIPLLVIGNEMTQTTIGHEKKWVELIHRLRKIYSGKITYGANWGNEFEKINFWNELDYIGISEYYPLSTKENPTDEELKKGAGEILKKIEEVQKKYNMKVIFTEVGFRSSPQAWKTTYEKESRIDNDQQSQARAYDAVFNASYNKHWLAGMYWWKWPSYLNFVGHAQNDLYTPNNKSAEEVVKKWYSKSWN